MRYGALRPDTQAPYHSTGHACLQVTLRTVLNQGRGFVAKQQIRQGEQLLRIPESLLLTANKAAEECSFGQLLRDASLPDWSVLASYLVQLLDEQQQGQAGFWAPYIAILPERTGCILEWTPKEVCSSVVLHLVCLCQGVQHQRRYAAVLCCVLCACVKVCSTGGLWLHTSAQACQLQHYLPLSQQNLTSHQTLLQADKHTT